MGNRQDLSGLAAVRDDGVWESLAAVRDDSVWESLAAVRDDILDKKWVKQLCHFERK